MSPKERFLFPAIPYHGDSIPQNIVLNANLQEFSQRVGLICALEAGGSISPMMAYHRIKELWDQLRSSKRSLFGEASQDTA